MTFICSDGTDREKLDWFQTINTSGLVLNAQDTKNMLNAMAIVRQVTDSIGSSVLAKLSSLSANNLSNDVFDGNQLEQNVHIDATFPNVTNSHEVEDAINNLVNMATQRIHR